LPIHRVGEEPNFHTVQNEADYRTKEVEGDEYDLEDEEERSEDRGDEVEGRYSDIGD
jgi:hypothetical protein